MADQPAKYCYADGWIISEREPTRPQWLNPHYVTWLEALNAEQAETIERLRAFVTKLANPDFSRVSSPLGPLHAAGMCAEAEIVAKLAKEVLTDDPKPLPTESAKGSDRSTT